jgi:sugar phosphate isomerase/epimerase
MDRRRFLAGGLALASGSAAAAPSLASRICLFTDHLAGFSYEEVARMLKQLGVDGPDLTVRRGGLVSPDRVAEELPKAMAAFRDQGLTIPMITTNILSANEPQTRPILAAAAKLGIGYYKLGYYKYKDLSQWQQIMDATHRELIGLSALNREFNMRAGIHNHAGDSVGCAIWDAWEVLQSVDPERVGFYFDPAQAHIEGGKTGWNLGFRRAAPRLFMLAMKDYVWEKSDKGWRTRWVPLGQGMVSWPAVSELLRATRFPGPISLHIEYDPGGSTKTERYDRSLAAAERDLKFLRTLL